ncbi:MAG: hypothetical protein K1X75_06285 [Leptospirales bacterium]|nr:hypothetical protein [Leptospirales bacterium]
MDELLIGIYKGLRLPLLGMVLLFITWYIYRPSRKRELEQARFDMLNDELDPELGERARMAAEGRAQEAN